MIARNDGGPAYPVPSDQYPEFNGMTLRDYFAGQALAQIIGSLVDWPDEKSEITAHAEVAYMYSDAMLAAREATS